MKIWFDIKLEYLFSLRHKRLVETLCDKLEIEMISRKEFHMDTSSIRLTYPHYPFIDERRSIYWLSFVCDAQRSLIIPTDDKYRDTVKNMLKSKDEDTQRLGISMLCHVDLIKYHDFSKEVLSVSLLAL